MERLDQYSICVRTDSGQLVPVIAGRANPIGLYQLVIKLSDIRQLLPQLVLVINGHLVQHVDFTAEGMNPQGFTLEELGYGS